MSVTCKEATQTSPRFPEADGGNPTELWKLQGWPMLYANNMTQQISNSMWGLEHHFKPSVFLPLYLFTPNVYYYISVSPKSRRKFWEFQVSPADNTNLPQKVQSSSTLMIKSWVQYFTIICLQPWALRVFPKASREFSFLCFQDFNSWDSQFRGLNSTTVKYHQTINS